MSRFNHGNNKQRFDLYTFYALLTKCKIVELLDSQGNTPFDSDTIDQNVWDYAAYLYKDITDVGLLSYFDSDSFRSDLNALGTTTWPAISKSIAVSQAYKPLRRFLYSLDSEEGIDRISDNITGNFNRQYYSLPLSDSEGVIKHTNVYTFLKTHFNRWFSYDPYERYKLASRIADLLNEDSDVRNQYGHQFLVACEEDSDLCRRLTELHSNVLQTDSEVRNEILLTSLTALRGLTPGGDSDAAVDLGHVITHVLNNNADSDSDIRTKFAWYFIKALHFDSDQADSDLQVRLGEIISNTELEYLESPLVYTRSLLPMDGDNTGNIGDSDKRWSFINFSTLRSDDVKIRNSDKDNLVVVADSEGRLEPTNYGDTNFYKGIEWRNDAELFVNAYYLRAINKINTGNMQVTTLSKERLVLIGDSESALATNDKLQWQSDTELDLDASYLRATNKVNTGNMQVTTLSKDRIVIIGDSEGTLSEHNNLQWQGDNLLNVVDKINATGRIKVASVRSSGFTSYYDAVYIKDSEGTLGNATIFRGISSETDSEFVLDVNLKVNDHASFDGLTVRNLSLSKMVIHDSEGRLISANQLEWTNDSDDPLQIKGKKLIAIDSDTFYNLLLENQNLYSIDSDMVSTIIRETPILSEVSWPIGQIGEVYFIDSEQANQLATNYLVFTSDTIVNTQAELSRALNNVVTFAEIFNTWYRFSHQYTGGGATYTYPYNATEASSGWAYDSNTDTIYTTINSVTYAGFISPEVYDDYRFTATVNAPWSAYPNSDDDTISMILGFVTEGVNGQPGYREHTLSVIRTHGGFPMTDQNFGNVTWALVYNYNQDDVRMLVNGSGFGTASTGIGINSSKWGDSPNGSKIQVRRKGDLITAYCSQMNTTTIDSDTEITFNLASDSDTLKFRGPVRYGYGAHSQQGSYWSSIDFSPDIGSYIHYVKPLDGSSIGGNVYEYDTANAVWNLDSDLSFNNTAGKRILHNPSTRKTFYNTINYTSQTTINSTETVTSSNLTGSGTNQRPYAQYYHGPTIGTGSWADGYNGTSLYSHLLWSDNSASGGLNITFYVDKVGTYSYLFGAYAASGSAYSRIYVNGSLVASHGGSGSGTFSVTNTSHAINVQCNYPSSGGWTSSSCYIGGSAYNTRSIASTTVINTNEPVIPIMSARKFSDVINLPTLTSEPSLIAGTFAIADGVNWDPVSYGAPAHVVFYDGSYWWYVDAQ